MIVISANTFEEAGHYLYDINAPVESLELRLHSTFDAPAMHHVLSQSQSDCLAAQTTFITEPLTTNPYLSNLKQFKFYCYFTLNDWKSFKSIVDALNSKNDSIHIRFVTSVKITNNSFIHQMKNASGMV